MPGWGLSSWWWPQQQTTGCSTGCQGPLPTRVYGAIAWATSATCRRRALVRLRAEPGLGSGLRLGAEPVAQRRKGTNPRSLSMEGTKLGFQFCSAIADRADGGSGGRDDTCAHSRRQAWQAGLGLPEQWFLNRYYVSRTALLC